MVKHDAMATTMAFFLLMTVAMSLDNDEETLRSQYPYEAPTALVQRDLNLHNKMVKTASSHKALPSYVIDLDLPARERWKDFGTNMRTLLLPKFHQFCEHKYLPKLKDPHWASYFRTQKLHPEHMEEVNGYLEAVNDSTLEVDCFRAAQFTYETGDTVGCTGILAAKPDGTVVHARNIDLGDEPEKRFMGEFIFTKGGKPLFTMASSTYGDIGLATGMRYKNEDGEGWSFEQNTRSREDPLNKHNEWLDGNLVAAMLGGNTFAWRARKIMEETPDFKTALNLIQNEKWSATHYFVMAGAKPWEGAVITVDRESQEKQYQKSHHKAMNNVQVLSKEIGRWNIAAYNYDKMDVAPDPRRDTANKLLAELGQENVSEKALLRIVRAPGIFSKGTFFSWVGTPAESTHQIYMHDDPVP